MGTWKHLEKTIEFDDTENHLPLIIDLVPKGEEWRMQNPFLIKFSSLGAQAGHLHDYHSLFVYYDEDKVPIEWRKVNKYTRAQWQCEYFKDADGLVKALNELDVKFQFTAKVRMTFRNEDDVIQYWLFWSEYA